MEKIKMPYYMCQAMYNTIGSFRFRGIDKETILNAILVKNTKYPNNSNQIIKKLVDDNFAMVQPDTWRTETRRLSKGDEVIREALDQLLKMICIS